MTKVILVGKHRPSEYTHHHFNCSWHQHASIQFFIQLIGFHHKHYTVLNTHQVDKAAHHLPLLEVGFTVQCGRLNLTQAVWVAAAEQQNIRWQNLIAAQTNEVSDPHLFPVFLHITFLTPTKGTRKQMWFTHNHATKKRGFVTSQKPLCPNAF